MSEVYLGRENHHVVLRIRGKESGNESDDDDPQWLRTDIGVVAGGLRASILDATLTVGELRGYLEDLERLVGGFERVARLDSMEEWIELVIEMNSRGGLEVRGRVSGLPGNALEFTLEDLDQTYLPPLIDALGEALSPYV